MEVAIVTGHEHTTLVKYRGEADRSVGRDPPLQRTGFQIKAAHMIVTGRCKHHESTVADRMMGEINALVDGSSGVLDEADYQRTVDILLSGGSDPVITKEPEGAWSHAVTDKAGL